METGFVLAGFGGQGILLIGKMLAYAGMHEGREVSWLPSYGPEMRGGTCNCTVVVSDRPVGSPVVERPRVVLAMNLPSMEKFEPALQPGGVLLYNTSLIHREASRSDVRVVKIPANEIAMELGSVRSANVVALGALVGATGAVSLDSVREVVRGAFAEKPKLVAPNLEALRRGHVLGESVAAIPPPVAARPAEARP